MRNRVLLIWMVATFVASVVLILTGARAYSALRNVIDAEREFTRLSSQAAELSRLHGSVPGWISRERSEGPLAPKISAVLAQAGLSAASLQSLSGEASVAALSGNLAQEIPAKRRRAVLTLSGLTLPQVGKVLTVARASLSAWTVTSLEISPEAGVGPGKGARELAATGGDMPLRVVATIETVYLDQAQPPKPAAQGARR